MIGVRLYWDTNAFIRMVEADDVVARELGRIFARAIEGEISIFSSELTLAELLVAPLRGPEDDLIETYRDLFEGGGGVTVIGVDRQVLLAAAQIRAISAVTKLPDAIHIATSELNGCSHFLSSDRRFPARPLLRRVPLDMDMLRALNEEDQ